MGFADDLAFVLLDAGVFFFTTVFTDVLGGVVLRTAFAFAAGLLFAFAGFLARAVGLAVAFRAATDFVGRFLAVDDLAGVFLDDLAVVFFMAAGFFAGAFLALVVVLLEDVFAVLDTALRVVAFATGLRADFAVLVFFVAIIPITVAIVETSCRSRGIHPAYYLDLLYELAAFGRGDPSPR